MTRRSLLVTPPLLALAACAPSRPLPVLSQIAPFTLTDENGRPFSRDQLQGHVWVADFIFTHCPGPCPLLSAKLRRLQDATQSTPDVHFVSFTVDPDRDTPAVLKAYAENFHADPKRWHFLTGDKNELNELGRKSFLLNDVDGTFEHSTRYALVDKNATLRGTYLSLDPEAMAQLPKDIAQLRKS